MVGLPSLLLLLPSSALVAALPSPLPTSAAELDARAVFAKRDTCNADNCLRALRARSSSASSFCTDYTANCAYFRPTESCPPLPTPTYVPSTCGPGRVSSACYCLAVPATPTVTPPPCAPSGQPPAAAQVLERPSFYYYEDAGYFDISPWVLTYDGGGPGCLPASGYSNADMGGPWGDYKYISCAFGSGAGRTGLSTVNQDAPVCAGTKYTFTAHTACPRAAYYFRTAYLKFRVLINGKQVVPWTDPCFLCHTPDPNDPDYDPYCVESSEVKYVETSGDWVAPAGVTRASVRIEVQQFAGSNDTVNPMFLDQVYLRTYGYTGQ